MGKKKTYIDEFKPEALRLLETIGKPVAVLERELGLSSGLLHHWRRRFQINETT